MLTMVVVLGSASAVRADYFDDIDTRTLGSYNDQAAEWSDPYGRRSLDVGNVDAFSGPQSLQNAPGSPTPSVSRYTFSPAETGQDVVVSFMFKRTEEYLWTELNRVRIDVYGSNGNRAAVSVKSGRIYDENNSWNVIENIQINTWYKLELAMLWNGTDYGDNMARVTVYDDQGYVINNGIVIVTTTGIINDVDYINLAVNNGGSGPGPDGFIDDISITNSVSVVPAAVVSLTGTPVPYMIPTGPGLYVTFDQDAVPISYGMTSLFADDWSFNGSSGSTSNGAVQYRTTLANDGATVTTMSDTEDWILELVYKHEAPYTGTERAMMTLLSQNAPDTADRRILSLVDRGNNIWGFRHGMAAGWQSIGDTFSMTEDYYTITVHYKASAQAMDVYVDRLGGLFISDVTTANNNYAVDFVGLESMQTGTDRFSSLKLARFPEASDAGWPWVRGHSFTIQGLTMLPYYLDGQEYLDAEMNTLLIWKGREGLFQIAEQYGLPWNYMAVSKQLDMTPIQLAVHIINSKNSALYFYQTYPGGTGFSYWDEPRHPAVPTLTELLEWSHQTFPAELAYTNVYSGGSPDGKYYDTPKDGNGNYTEPPVPYTYDIYLAEIVATTKTDVLNFIIYPFVDYPGTPDTVYIYTRYFYTLAENRKVALNWGIPCWAFLQSYEHAAGNRYYPSESDLRMQIFSSLAYGVTGLLYFTYEPVFDRALLDWPDSGTPTYLYYAAAAVNAEVLNLGKTLRFLNSTDVRFIPAQGNSLPTGTVAFDASASAPYQINDITVNNTDKNAVIGFFKDIRGERYFMLVNVGRAKDKTAAEMQSSITITFDPSVTGIWRLSRATGLVEPVPVTNGTLDVTLPGGTGDLFKLGDGNFIADGVSEPAVVSKMSVNELGQPVLLFDSPGLYTIMRTYDLNQGWSVVEQGFLGIEYTDTTSGIELETKVFYKATRD